jgi:hypothetical protein
MKSLDLIIESSLKPQLIALSANNTSVNFDMEKHVRILQFLREYHELRFGPLNDTEIKPLNEQNLPMIGNPKIGTDLAKGAASSFAASNKKQILNILKSSEKVKKDFLGKTYNFISNNKQAAILKYIKTGKYDKATPFKKWKNTTADNFFKQIVEQDPQYDKADTGDRMSAGYVFDKSNADNQWYDYEILCTDNKGKSIAFMRFHPDDTVTIMPETLSMAKESAFTYKVTGNKISIYSELEKGAPILTGVPNDYTLMFTFNNKFLEKNYDPYKGAGFLRALWLDITGVKRAYEKKWKNQKEYDSSPDRWQDSIQSVLDWAGLIPGYGDVIDIINGIWYWARGKKLEALLSMIAVIPIIGSVIKGGFKLAFKGLKIGSKTGIDALQYLIVQGPKAWSKGAREAFSAYLARNKAAREAVKSFAKRASSAVRSGIRRLVDIARNLRGRAVVGWVGRVLDDIVAKYGKPLQEFADKTAKSMDDVARAMDTASDLKVVGSKATAEVVGYAGGKGLRQVLKGLTTELAKDAGIVTRMFYRIVGKKWFDAFQRSMIDSFIQYVKRGGGAKATQKFFTTLVATPNGGRIVLEAAQSYFTKGDGPRLLTTWLLNRKTLFQKYFKSSFSNFGEKTIEQIGDEGMREIAVEFVRILKGSLGKPEFIKTVTDLVLQPLLRNADALNKFLDDVIIDCIQKGNAVYKIWAMSFWNYVRAALPNRISRFFDAKGIGAIKYEFGGRKIFDLEGIVGKWVSKAFQESPIINKYLGGLIRGILKILDGMMNLKRLDVFYNEFRDFFEKIGVDSNNIDEKQGVIATIIKYVFGTAPFDLIKGVIGFGSEVISPADLGQFKAVSEIPMVKQQKFTTPLEK